MKGVPFVNRRNTKGVPFLWKMANKRVRGRTSGRSLPVQKFVEYSPPQPPRRDLLSDNSLVLLQFLRLKNTKSCQRIVNVSPLSKILTFVLRKGMWRVSKNDLYCPQHRSCVPLQSSLLHSLLFINIAFQQVTFLPQLIVL